MTYQLHGIRARMHSSFFVQKLKFKHAIQTFNSAIQTFSLAIQTFSLAIQTFSSAIQTFKVQTCMPFKLSGRQFKYSIELKV